MAWNLPGKSGSDKGGKDPWKGRDPDRETDAFLDRLKQGLGRMFGGEPGENDTGPRFALWIGILVAVWLVFSSIQLVNQNQSGVVLRYGQFNRIMTPGMNLKWPWPIESVTKVDATNVRSAFGQMNMLTNDQNIVQVDYNVQYTVADPRLFLFGNSDPEKTLQQAAESVVREVVGASTMDDVLKGQGAVRTARARDRLQEALDQYRTGLVVSDFTLKNARPPQEVKEAFDDVSRAQQDKDKSVNLARAYASDAIPRARGQAASLLTGAAGYKEAIIAEAQGNAQRYSLLADQYHKAPEVTRKRLYLETMEDVLRGSPKVVAGRGNNTIYLPSEHTVQDAAAPASSSGNSTQPVNLPAVNAAMPSPADDSARPDRAPRSDGREPTR
ncbi:MAG TPA: FtsH protease activity modulator HflK [Xanthomonadaceae bacterium]|jgi:membrane protease subunit HflK|nr:FtsH protease activity modulator HflK [Xanthomonadaceae bacterium]